MSSRLLRIFSIFLVAGMLILPISASADHDPYIVHGTVFNDLNQDGVFDEGEEGIENVPVDLWSEGVVSDSTLTDVDGYFEFTLITTGSYSLVETDLVGYVSTTPNEVDFEVDGTTIIPIIDFGDVPVDALAGISGTVYDDLNRNRLLDPGEPGLADVVILLKDSEGAELESVTTDVDGNYAFSELWAGTYSVREEDPEGYYSTTAHEVTVTLQVGEALADVNFGDFVPEPGELSPIDPLISGFFDLPILDILDLRSIQNMGYGNVAKVYFAAMLSGEPVSAILEMLEMDGGWGNVLREVIGFPSLKGYNLGLIVSGREAPAQVENLLDGCSIVETPEQVQALMGSGLGQGTIKKLCSMVMEAGGDYDTLVEAVNMRADKAKWKDIEEAIQNPGGESQETSEENGPPACKGKNKNDPGC